MAEQHQPDAYSYEDVQGTFGSSTRLVLSFALSIVLASSSVCQ
jgi:hypothetical protein